MGMLFLGVDGGQTSTTLLIGNEAGQVLGFGRGGPCGYVGGAEGRERFAAVIEQALAEACRSGGIPRDEVEFQSGVFGFSGGPPGREPVIRELLRAARLKVTSDVEIALTGAFGGEPGIITIAGTGSASCGRNAEGQMARAGGWGAMFGDEGAAFDIARQALRAALRSAEGWGPQTVLQAKLLAATGTGHVHDLVRKFYTAEFPTSRIAGYARLVDDAAREGDEVARNILWSAAAYLAELTGVIRRRLFPTPGRTRVAYIGGTFRIPVLVERFCTLIGAAGTGTVGPPLYGPAAGALLEAYRAEGLCPALTGVPQFEK